MIEHQTLHCSTGRTPRAKRRGSILLLTLVVVSGLALGALAFAQTLILELDAIRATQQQAELRRFADSGLEAVAATLEARHSAVSRRDPSSERRLRQVAVYELEGAMGRFTIQPGLQTVDSSAGAEFQDETAKLNLNALPLESVKRDAARDRLTILPGMTPAMADAILDWMDQDDEPSEFGAEAAWYSRQDPPRLPRNGRLQSLDELLQVRGVTSELLYGHGADAGLSQYLSIYGAESNLRPDGQPRINLNQQDLVALYDVLQQEFDDEVARFIVAWRLAGTTTGVASSREDARQSRKEIHDAARRRLARQLNAARGRLASTDDSTTPEVTRGGLNLSRKPAYRIRSVYDLVDVNVRIDVDRRDTVLKSPWKGDVRFFERQLPALEEILSVSGESSIPGRINLNLASREVLLTVPGIDAGIADRIIATRQRRSSGARRSPSRTTVSWLLTERIVDLAAMRTLAPHLTGQGDVVSGYSIGHRDGSDTAVAIEFVIDGSGRRARIIQRHDLPPLRLPVR